MHDAFENRQVSIFDKGTDLEFAEHKFDGARFHEKVGKDGVEITLLVQDKNFFLKRGETILEQFIYDEVIEPKFDTEEELITFLFDAINGTGTIPLPGTGTKSEINRVTGLFDGATISIHNKNIASIQGNGGSPNTVTVDTDSDHDLTTGDSVDISGTSGYDEINLTITVISSDRFTYQTSSHTLSSQETVGFIADKRRFEITSGKGVILDLTDPLIPILTEVTITQKLAVLDTFLSDTVTYLLIDSTDGIIQQNTAPTVDQRRTAISIGRIVKASNKIIVVVNNAIIGYGLDKTFEDFLLAHGGIAFSGGGNVSANGANLNLDNAAGVIMSLGRGFSTGKKNSPNTADVPQQSPIPLGKLFKLFVDGTGKLITDTATNDIDPDNYNNAGTLTAVPVGKYTIQRLFLFPETNILTVYYGPQTHNSLAGAQAAIMIEDFAEHDDTRPGAFKGWLIVQEGTIDLQDAITNNKAAIIDADVLRPSTAGGTDAQLQSITGQYVDPNVQKPIVTTPVLITFGLTKSEFGIEHTPGSGRFKFKTSGRYDHKVQPQLERTGSGGNVFFHMWPRKGRGDGAITAIGTGANAPITSKDHRLQSTQQITISGVTTTPDINGLQTVTVIDADTFHVGVTITSVTDAIGSWTRDFDILDDISDSNVEENLQNVAQSDVLPLIFNEFFKEEDAIEFVMSVSDATKGGGLIVKTPAGESRIPSIIYDVIKIGTD